MSTFSPQPPIVFRREFVVPDNAVDDNGHVNNVVYIQWMQDVAVMHADAVEGTRATRAAGATWVVRSHRIDYLRPAFAGDAVLAQTWVANIRRVRSLRRYRFLRASDRAILAQGETDWVFVNQETGRPISIPSAVRDAFPVDTGDPAAHTADGRSE